MVEVNLNTVLLVGLIVFFVTVASSIGFGMVYSIYKYLQEVRRSEENQQTGYLMPMAPQNGSGGALSLSDLMKMYSAAKKETDTKSADAGSGTYL